MKQSDMRRNVNCKGSYVIKKNVNQCKGNYVIKRILMNEYVHDTVSSYYNATLLMRVHQ